MRVAIDAGPLESGHKVRGVGFYTRSLIEALESLSRKVGGLKIDAFNFEKDEMKVKAGFYDIVHIPYFNPFINPLPKEKPAKIVVTVHDLIPLLYPAHYIPGFRNTFHFQKHKRQMREMVDAVICDTETSKKDIVRLLGISEKKITPVYLSSRPIFKSIKDRKELIQTQKKYNLPHTFVLYVGDINYNKNIANLVRACDLCNIPLVMVGKEAHDLGQVKKEAVMQGPQDMLRSIRGKVHPEILHLEELKQLFATQKQIYRLGFIPDSDLVEIYNLATLYCQPSLYEGFGLPALEAAASGCPLVCAKTQSLVEIWGDAALYFDPYDYKNIAKQVDRVIRDAYLKVALIRASEKRVKEFSWEKTAKETYDVYKKVFQDERRLARHEKPF